MWTIRVKCSNVIKNAMFLWWVTFIQSHWAINSQHVQLQSFNNRCSAVVSLIQYFFFFFFLCRHFYPGCPCSKALNLSQHKFLIRYERRYMDLQISPKSPLFFFQSSLSWPPDSTQLLHSNRNIDSEADPPSSATARIHQVEQFAGRLTLYLLLFWFQSGSFKGCNLTFALSESGWIYQN